MINRRLAIGGAICLCAGRASAQTDGCWKDANEGDRILRTAPRYYSITESTEIIHASGNDLLDRALARALYRLSLDFEVQPGFAYYTGNNAWATSANRMNKSDGTVLYGLDFMKTTLAFPNNPDAAVIHVCAHEFAHILQFKRGLFKRFPPNSKHSELHADYLSGWFSGLRKLNNPDYPAATFAAKARATGDFNTGSPTHHGTPDERGAAVENGFLASARDKLKLSDAIEAGIRYVGVFTPAPVVPLR